MYEDKFGTDWEELSEEELLERAFALGVSEQHGQPVPGEYERLLQEARTTYQRTLVELAYSEGKEKGGEPVDTERGEETDEAQFQGGELPALQWLRGERSEAPPALSRVKMLDPPGDGLDRIRLPDFLTR